MILNEQTNDCDLDLELTGTWDEDEMDGNYLLKFDDDADDDILMHLGIVTLSYRYFVEESTGLKAYKYYLEKQ
ncbi:hypothetical protein [Pseudotamlana carrageenivorans]|uniref:Uncharacterized protein n=1 Tax=Pseudotamlana carrageenivorans TaxID=2069432 RepID=A0A2I7SJP0_9FLAO|nr:hypothetical protein [Tamlana carrageenivorans]AUS06126.1 hypothetical protein C1A40_11985 [Tamlana carrageenivorans]